jgi:hypothetical protein
MAQNPPLLDADVFQQIQQKIDEDTDFSRVRLSLTKAPTDRATGNPRPRPRPEPQEHVALPVDRPLTASLSPLDPGEALPDPLNPPPRMSAIHQNDANDPNDTQSGRRTSPPSTPKSPPPSPSSRSSAPKRPFSRTTNGTPAGRTRCRTPCVSQPWNLNVIADSSGADLQRDAGVLDRAGRRADDG